MNNTQSVGKNLAEKVIIDVMAHCHGIEMNLAMDRVRLRQSKEINEICRDTDLDSWIISEDIQSKNAKKNGSSL